MSDTPPADGRPLLLLDIDGPLNPYEAESGPGLAGYRVRRLVGDPPRWTDRDEGGRVWLNPAHGPMLRAIADAGLAELVWATSWLDLANELVAPALGLPSLPVIALPEPDEFPRDRIWKRDAVEGYAAGRALAWFDDDFETPGDFAWAARRAQGGLPTLLVAISPRTGIVQADVDRVAAWAAAATAAPKPGAPGTPPP